MTTSATALHDGDREPAVHDERRAVRFFWTVLILATSASAAGNVAHAVLNAPASTVVVAAAAALVTGIERYHNDPNTFAVRGELQICYPYEGGQPGIPGPTERALRREAPIEAQESPVRQVDSPRVGKKVR
jgi:hypothetical protein